MTSAVVSLLLAAVLGFAAHRAGVCTVKAVAEVLGSGRGFMLVSIGKTVLWVIATSLALAWSIPAMIPPHGYPLTAATLGGGVLFGMGAAANRGCAFSTLSQLGSGHLGMAATLLGFALASAGHGWLGQPAPAPVPLPWSPPLLPGSLAVPVSGALWLWAGWEIFRLLRSRPRRMSWTRRINAERYRLSAAAALIGISGAVLFAVNGPWAYTTVLAHGAAALLTSGPGPDAVLVALAGAALAGVGVSAWASGRFRIRLPSALGWLRHLAGGMMMGLGAALVPGGNFTLVLNGIPMLSPHALPAFVALLVGIAVPMLVMRIATGSVMHIDCSGDVCRE